MSRQPLLPVVLAAALMCAGGEADAASADPREKLDFFLGTWTVKGSEATYIEQCEWPSLRSFVVCSSTDTDPRDPGKGISIFGYSPDDQTYTYTGLSSDGSARQLRGWHVDGVWKFTGQADRGPRFRRWQVAIAPTPTGFRFIQETSANGAEWQKSVEVEYVRIPQKAPSSAP
jgi:hypothetical protein